MRPRSSPSPVEIHIPSKAVGGFAFLESSSSSSFSILILLRGTGSRAGPTMVERSVEPLSPPACPVSRSLRSEFQMETGVFVRPAFSQSAKISMPRRPLSGGVILRLAFVRADGNGGDGGALQISAEGLVRVEGTVTSMSGLGEIAGSKHSAPAAA